MPSFCSVCHHKFSKLMFLLHRPYLHLSVRLHLSSAIKKVRKYTHSQQLGLFTSFWLIISVTTVLMEKGYCASNMWFIFLCNFMWNIFHSRNCLVSYVWDVHRNSCGSSCKCPLLLSDFGQTSNVSVNFSDTPTIRFNENPFSSTWDIAHEQMDGRMWLC